MSPAPATGAHQALKLINLLFMLLTLGALLWGLGHHSSEPQLWGRYSHGYAAFLAALALALSLQLVVLCCAGPRLLRWAGNLYTLLISTLIVIGLTELLLRAFNPWGMDFFHHLPYHMQGMLDDPQLGYRHPRSVSYQLGENRVELNAHGLRGDDITYNKPPGQRRLLVLGDSVAFGWGVSQGETFSDRLQPLLEQRSGEPWRVINGGVNGYNTEQERIWLEREGLRYVPDAVVLMYVVNDTDAVFDPNATTWRRYPEWPPSLPEALNRLRQLSYLFQGTHMFTRLRRAAAAAPASTDPDDPAAADDAASVTGKPRWPQSRDALLSIAVTLKQRGIPFLVAKNSGQDPEFFAQLAAADIAAVSMSPAWSRVDPDQAHVSRVDPHPAAPVHAEMAVELVKQLDRRGWLDQHERHTPPSSSPTPAP